MASRRKVRFYRLVDARRNEITRSGMVADKRGRWVKREDYEALDRKLKERPDGE